MSILLDENTGGRPGITGGEGTFHAKHDGIRDKVVAGMTPGKGGTKHIGVPVSTPWPRRSQSRGPTPRRSSSRRSPRRTRSWRRPTRG